MINNNTLQKLISVYLSLQKESLSEKGEGWVNMANFGLALVKAGINYKAMGYEKLNDFIIKSGRFVVYSDASGKVPVKYIKEKRTDISKKPKVEHVKATYTDSNEVIKVKRRLRLDNNMFIGQFAPQKNEGWYTITDIRNTDFTKIEDKERGVKNLSISFRSPKKEFNRYAYYKFTWVLLETDPLKFGIDLHEEIHQYTPKTL